MSFCGSCFVVTFYHRGNEFSKEYTEDQEVHKGVFIATFLGRLFLVSAVGGGVFCSDKIVSDDCGVGFCGSCFCCCMGGFV